MKKLYNDIMKLILLLILLLKLALNYIYSTVMYVFLLITLLWKYLKLKISITSILLFKLIYEFCIHYLLNMTYLLKIKIYVFTSKILNLFSSIIKKRPKLFNTIKIITSSFIKFKKPTLRIISFYNINLKLLLYSLYKSFIPIFLLLKSLLLIVLLAFILVFCFHFLNFINVELLFAEVFIHLKNILIYIIKIAHLDWYRYHEQYMFLTPESYLNLKGDWFIKLNVYFPIISFYTDMYSILKYLDGLLLFPIKDFFSSLTLYIHYQNLTSGPTGDAEFSLPYRLSIFYVYWQLSNYTFFTPLVEWYFLFQNFLAEDLFFTFFSQLFFWYESLLSTYALLQFLTAIFSNSYLWAYLLTHGIDFLGAPATVLLSFCGSFMLFLKAALPLCFYYVFVYWFTLVNIAWILLQKVFLIIFFILGARGYDLMFVHMDLLMLFSAHLLFYFNNLVYVFFEFLLSFLWLFFFSLFRWLGALIVYAVSWPLLFIWAILIYLFNTIWAMLAASLSTVFLVFASFFEVIAQFIPAAYFVFSLPLYILFSTFGFFLAAAFGVFSSVFELVYFFFNGDLFFFDLRIDSSLWFGSFAYLALLSFLTFLFLFSKNAAYDYFSKIALRPSVFSPYLTRLGLPPRFTSQAITKFESFRVLDVWVAARSFRGLAESQHLTLFASRDHQSSTPATTVFVVPLFNTGLLSPLWTRTTAVLRSFWGFYNSVLVHVLGYFSFSTAPKLSISKLLSVYFTLSCRQLIYCTKFFVIGAGYETHLWSSQTKISLLGRNTDGFNVIDSRFLGAPGFTLLFSFPWLAGTTAYEYLFWLHSDEIWRLQANNILRHAARVDDLLFNSSHYPFNSRILIDFASPHLAFEPENTNMHLLIHKYLKLAAQSEVDTVRVGRQFFWSVQDRDFVFNTINSRQLEFGRIWRWLYLKFTDFERYYANQDMVADDPAEVYYQEISWYTIPGWFKLMPLGLRKLFFGFVFPLLGNFTFVFEFFYTLGDDTLEQHMVNDIALSIDVMRSNKEPFRVKYNIYESFTNHKFFQLRQMINIYLWHAKIMDYIWSRWRQRQFSNFFKIFEEVQDLAPVYSEFNAQPFRFSSDLDTYDFRQPLVYNLQFKEWVFPIERLNYWTKGVAFKESPVSYELVTPFGLINEANRSSSYDLYRRLNYFWQDTMFVASIDVDPATNFGHWALDDVLYRAFYAQFYYKYVAGKQTYSFAISAYEHNQFLKKLRWRRFWDPLHTFRKFRWRMRFHTKPVEKWTTRLLFFLNTSKHSILNELSAYNENRLTTFSNSVYQILFAEQNSEIAWIAVDILRQPASSFLFRWFDFIWRLLLFKLTSLLQFFYQFHMPAGLYNPWSLSSSQGWAWNFRSYPVLIDSFANYVLTPPDPLSLQLYVYSGEDEDDDDLEYFSYSGLLLSPTADALMSLTGKYFLAAESHDLFSSEYLPDSELHFATPFFRVIDGVIYPNHLSTLINTIGYPEPELGLINISLLPSRTHIVLANALDPDCSLFFLSAALAITDPILNPTFLTIRSPLWPVIVQKLLSEDADKWTCVAKQLSREQGWLDLELFDGTVEDRIKLWLFNKGYEIRTITGSHQAPLIKEYVLAPLN